MKGPEKNPVNAIIVACAATFKASDKVMKRERRELKAKG